MQKHCVVSGLLWLAAFLPTCHTATCQSPPTVQLIMGNCTLLNGNDETSDVYSWGIRMAVAGSQEICIVPSTVVNSTFVTAEEICNDDQLVDTNQLKMTPRQCRSRRGGFIDPSVVPAADKGPLDQLNPGWESLNNTIEAAISGSLQIDRKPVTMVEGLITEGQMSTQSHLGLASGSTVLQTLKDAEMIGARSWGLNSGSQSVLFPRRGSLVLGGYDEASLASPFFDFPIQNTLQGKRHCPLQVTITDMAVSIQNANNSKTTPIIDQSDVLEVCIEPYDNLFRMPNTTLSHLRTFFRNFTLHPDDPLEPADYEDTLLNLEPGLVYPRSAGDFNATLRITINNVLTVEVPHYEFQRPLRGLNKDGEVVLDTSRNELQIYGYPPEEHSPVIGKALLSQLYLFVDYESMMFHLALQNLDANTPLPVSSVDCGKGGGLSTTNKVLIAVAAVLGALLLLVVLFGYFFYRRFVRTSHQQQHKPSGAPAPVSSSASEPTPAGGGNENIPLGHVHRDDEGALSGPTDVTVVQPPPPAAERTIISNDLYEGSRPRSPQMFGSGHAKKPVPVSDTGKFA